MEVKDAYPCLFLQAAFCVYWSDGGTMPMFGMEIPNAFGTLAPGFANSLGAPLSRVVITRTCVDVVADIYARLSSLAALGQAPRGWEQVPFNYPCLGVNATGYLFCRIPNVDAP